MKYSNTFVKGILLIGSLGLFFSCVEPLPELPPETQTGAGTFGCLVNNELVFTDRWQAGANYVDSIDQLQISAQCQFGQQFRFFINNPYKSKDMAIDTIRYLPPNASKWTKATQTGSLHFSRIDNRIVSATFSFDFNETGETPIHVTKGRFDLNVYNY